MTRAHESRVRYTPVPPAIAHAWQIMAATAHVLDPPYQPKLRELIGMLTISEAMDTLVDVDPRYPPIAPADHAPHTPAQAASCTLAHLDTHTPTTTEEHARLQQVQRLLSQLLDLDQAGRPTIGDSALRPSSPARVEFERMHRPASMPVGECGQIGGGRPGCVGPDQLRGDGFEGSAW